MIIILFKIFIVNTLLNFIMNILKMYHNIMIYQNGVIFLKHTSLLPFIVVLLYYLLKEINTEVSEIKEICLVSI